MTKETPEEEFELQRVYAPPAVQTLTYRDGSPAQVAYRIVAGLILEELRHETGWRSLEPERWGQVKVQLERIREAMLAAGVGGR